MASPRALHVRCSTWEQVDAFLTRKLRKGRFLSMKVPFVGEIGVPVTLGLELPNQLVVAIDGTVQQASPIEREASGVRSWIEIELAGLTPEVLARIRSLASGAEDLSASASAPVQVAPAAPPRTSIAQMGEDLPEDERALFQHLTGELRRLRQVAVHEVLGVAAGAKPEEVRAAWQKNVRRFHPDLVARRRAPAISHLAEELTILANRAYDRLRAALAAEGQIALAGPSLALQPGWLVGFDDISSGEGRPPPARKVERAASPVMARAAAPSPPPSAAASGVEAFEQRARAMLGQGDANNAREVLAAALVVYPRSKPLRSMYYVASAFAALLEGEVVLATAQLETALAHHEQCREAFQLLEHIRKHAADANEAARRYFA